MVTQHGMSLLDSNPYSVRGCVTLRTCPSVSPSLSFILCKMGTVVHLPPPHTHPPGGCWEIGSLEEGKGSLGPEGRWEVLDFILRAVGSQAGDCQK